MSNLTKSTKPISDKNIHRSWHMVDANGKVLGRVATEVAGLLMGKGKTTYVSHLDSGDNVVVINAQQIMVTGNKAKTKVYDSFSGYPGGLKKVSFERTQQKNPGEIIKRAVSGMLPKNKLRDRRITRLYIYKGTEHPYAHKFNVSNLKPEADKETAVTE